jgi:glucose-6-phosphate 1-epimerase
MQQAIEFHGLPAVRLEAPDRASAVVTHHGAHVVSWRTPDGVEQLYLSERSGFAPGKAIRGGIPVIFPQFATLGPLPRHGFARTAAWEAIGSAAPLGAAAAFRLAATPATRALWPHDFEATVVVTLGAARLDVALQVANRGGARFAFSAALHTYLRVADIAAVRVTGLAGCGYRDQAANGRECLQDGAPVAIDGEVDRIYRTVASPLRVLTGDRSVEVTAEGFSDVVLWNPGPEKCAQLDDMPPDGFRRMLCVEAAVVERPVVLVPGERWSGRQSLRAGT